MEAAGELAHLLDNGLDVALDPLELGARVPLVLRDLRPDTLEIEADRKQPLLRPVVQVPLDPPQRFVAGRDEACAGRDQVRACGRVRDRGADELCELVEPLLRLPWERRAE